MLVDAIFLTLTVMPQYIACSMLVSCLVSFVSVFSIYMYPATFGNLTRKHLSSDLKLTCCVHIYSEQNIVISVCPF